MPLVFKKEFNQNVPRRQMLLVLGI